MTADNMRDRRSRFAGRRSRDKNNDVSLGSVLNRILYWVVLILTFPVRVVQWLTQPPGSAVLFGLGVLYFIGLSCEGYWQAAIASAPSFILKPFIADGANPLSVLTALISPSFWVAATLSTVVQAIQASTLRDIQLAQAQAEYEAISGYSVPEARSDAPELLEFKRRQIKQAGMKALRLRGFVCLLAYGIDTIVSFSNFPLFGLAGVGEVLRNFTWILLSIFGAECAIALFLDALEKGKNAIKVQPKVEVVE